METSCDQCSKIFEIFPYKLKKQIKKFCSTECQYAFKKKRVNLVCKVCEKNFDVVKSRFENQKQCFCSKKCADKALIVPRLFRNCADCGVEFSFLESRLKHTNVKFCSIDCCKNFKKGKKNRCCINCSKKFNATLSQIKNERGKYCSKECYNSYAVGKNSPNYKNGVKFFKEFSSKRCSSCQICNKVCRTDVHHIDGNSFNNVESNYISLCRSCHTRVHSLSGRHSMCIKKSLEIFKIIIDLPPKDHLTWGVVEKLKLLSLKPDS